MRMLAFDPGGTTGWAMYTDEDPNLPPTFSCGEIGPHEHHEQLWDFIRFHQFLRQGDSLEGPVKDYRIVCESFEFRNNDKKRDNIELISREYIGIIKLYASMFDINHLVFQTAAQGKIRERKSVNNSGSFVKRRHLERLGLWSSKTGHAMDAYGHLLYHIIHAGKPEYRALRLYLLKHGWKEIDDEV